MNIIRSDVFSNATQHIPEFIELIKILESKGFTYQTDEAVYFDVKKFPSYGKLSYQKLEEKMTRARGEVHLDAKKETLLDFALWFKATVRFKDHVMRWYFHLGRRFPWLAHRVLYHVHEVLGRNSGYSRRRDRPYTSPS